MALVIPQADMQADAARHGAPLGDDDGLGRWRGARRISRAVRRVGRAVARPVRSLPKLPMRAMTMAGRGVRSVARMAAPVFTGPVRLLDATAPAEAAPSMPPETDASVLMPMAMPAPIALPAPTSMPAAPADANVLVPIEPAAAPMVDDAATADAATADSWLLPSATAADAPADPGSVLTYDHAAGPSTDQSTTTDPTSEGIFYG